MYLEGGCNFQTGFCGWYNAAMGDDFDWTVHAGSTASSATGPRADHNGNTNGTFFLLTQYNRNLINIYLSYVNSYLNTYAKIGVRCKAAENSQPNLLTFQQI